MENVYWTRDYISGIRSFLRMVDEQSELLKHEIDDIKLFNEQCWIPFVKSLARMKRDNVNDMFDINGLVEQFDGLRIEEQLHALIDGNLMKLYQDNKVYHKELSIEIEKIYEIYHKDLVSLREKYIECDRIRNRSKNNNNNDDDDSNRFVGITFPYKFDDRIIIDDTEGLIKWIEMLRNKVHLSKNFFQKEYFAGQDLMNEIKKSDLKIDSSLYNLNRIGQDMMELGIIEEYSARTLYMNKMHIIFDIDKYYYWVEPITSSVEMTTIENVDESYQEYYRRYCKLENSKVMIENLHFKNCKYYNNKKPIILKQINETRETFMEIVHKSIFKSYQIRPYNFFHKAKNDLSLFGNNFFSRDNCIPFIRQNGDKFMFGIDDLNTPDIVNSIEQILEEITRNIQEFRIGEDDIVSMWQDSIDIVRSSQLKLDLLTLFQSSEDFTNAETIKVFAEGNKSTSKYLARDWIDLMKLFLLELPGGLVHSDNDKNHVHVLECLVSHWVHVASSSSSSSATLIRRLLHNNGNDVKYCNVPLVTTLIRYNNNNTTKIARSAALTQLVAAVCVTIAARTRFSAVQTPIETDVEFAPVPYITTPERRRAVTPLRLSHVISPGRSH